MRWTNPKYLAIRKFVDYDLSRGPTTSGQLIGNSRKPIYMPPSIVLAAITLELLLIDKRYLEAIAISIPISVIFAFIAWRYTRIIRAREYKSARYFERKARYAMAPEYHDATSSILDARRRKIAKQQVQKKTTE